MKPHVQHTPGGLAAAWVLAGLAAGCAPPGLSDRPWSDTGELTLVGDRNVSMAKGTRFDLEVRYHDDDFEPLAGVVEFELVGDARGAKLSQRAATTDSSGRAAVTLDATAALPGSFRVAASALDADQVEWAVTIDEAGEPPMDPVGIYRADSQFSAQAHEGAVGDALGTALQAMRSPGHAVLDSAAYLGWITPEEASSAGPELAALLEEEAPAAVSALRFIGDDLASASRAFAASSELRISGSGGAFAADHALDSFVISFAGEEHIVTLDELGVESLAAGGVNVGVSGEARLFLAEHRVPLPYGTLLLTAVDHVMGAEAGAGVAELSSTLRAALFAEDDFGCRGALVDWFELRFDNLDPITADSACREAVEHTSDEILGLDELAGTEGELVIDGEASLVDSNRDDAADELVDGVWRGSIEHGGAPAATLADGSSLFGAERVDAATR